MSSSPYSLGYTSTYSASYGSGSGSGGGVGGSNRGTSSYDRYYSYYDEPKRNAYGSSSSSSKRGSASNSYSSSSSSSAYTPRYLMSSDLLGIERAAAGGRSAFSSGKLSEGPSHDHLGRKLSNYDRWRVQQGKDDSATSTSTSTPSTVTHSGSGGVGGVGGGRRKTNASSSSRGNNSNSVRFADAPETRTFRADEDDDAVVGGDSLSALREMSMGPSASRYSSSSSARSPSARATSLKPEMSSSSSSSSYRPSFGSSSSYSSPSSYVARSFPTGVANKVTYTGIPHLKNLSQTTIMSSP